MDFLNEWDGSKIVLMPSCLMVLAEVTLFVASPHVYFLDYAISLKNEFSTTWQTKRTLIWFK
jgi:hypothetical protein